MYRSKVRLTRINLQNEENVLKDKINQITNWESLKMLLDVRQLTEIHSKCVKTHKIPKIQKEELKPK